MLVGAQQIDRAWVRVAAGGEHAVGIGQRIGQRTVGIRLARVGGRRAGAGHHAVDAQGWQTGLVQHLPERAESGSKGSGVGNGVGSGVGSGRSGKDQQVELAADTVEPPLRLAVDRQQGRVDRRRAGAHRRGGKATGIGGIGIGSIRRTVIGNGGRRQSAAVDHAPRKRQRRGQLEGGVAKRQRNRGLGRDEVGTAGGVEDVLVGGRLSFLCPGVENRFIGFAANHADQPPGERIGILDARVAAARAER